MDEYKKAFTEVYYFVNQLREELRNEIPDEVIDNIAKRIDKSYIPNRSNMSQIGKAILSVIYSEYLCSDSEKKKWNEIDELYLKNFQKHVE
ncbi:MAG: hypothetical protein J6J36_02295 [Clostridia bacterium]|nr:hypothetical protein [Clostridia bacterium]